MNTETISWIPASHPPDDDLTVLLFNKQANEPVWPGYKDGNRWRSADGLIANPTHWAVLPGGPTQ